MAVAEWDHCHAHTPGDTRPPNAGKHSREPTWAEGEVTQDLIAAGQPVTARQILRRLDRRAAHRDGHLDGARLVRAAPRRERRCTEYGAPGVTRTPGTQFRKLLLYPPELRGRPLPSLVYQTPAAGADPVL